MKVLVKNTDQNLIINPTQDFKLDLGWQENMTVLEDEILETIINPIENYETVRYVHKPYSATTIGNQTDIWFYFYFIDNSLTYNQGLDYNLVGYTSIENELMLAQTTESFFRLEFYKTPSGVAPTHSNRRMVFAKNLSLPNGEKFFYTTLNGYIHVPVFTGSNYRNKENMYLFWFMDDTAFDETNITGNTFYMTARFFNAKDGSTLDFTNKKSGSAPLTTINETNDLYYQMIIDRTDFSYQIYDFSSGVQGARIGQTINPIKFYERKQ